MTASEECTVDIANEWKQYRKTFDSIADKKKKTVSKK